ncbi:cyclic diguanylate phosphodiesterase [Klebsiella pneumoniae]|nr:EAL domain-containing protein [Klebsiella pneumoniae]HBQ6039994.1 EAL domain-containing protein [Klebsiella pneumoniae subsp. pneumoniae]RGO49909.1 cyclic diguanylate phosphodiesterase [Klebsiella pneumoniae]SVX20600.1 cyclic diguanylate phosphodiesterase (EAL) domain-containing protein [Klebsiella pneumoniae]SWB73764.1 cyclic diguanylate phosphodiesterase (EAL) domain-containing protein [Klebsiella pneumoniae]
MKEIKRRNAWIAFSLALVVFLAGVFVINWQLWHSDLATHVAAARQAAKKIAAILDEAHAATATALNVSRNGCSGQGQFQLGTEAALQPHLRTILLIKDGQVWCSSLPGNRVLTLHPESLPDEKLQLLPARMMVNKRPVLIYHTRSAQVRVIVSISDIHLRDALYSDEDNAGLALSVNHQMIARYGDVGPLKASPHQDIFSSPDYPFRIIYPESPFFSPSRLFQNGFGLLIFIFSVSLLFYFLLRKYLNVYTSEEENLRYAIAQGYIVPFYQPVVNGKTGEIYGVEILARWKNATTQRRSPAEFIPLAERTGLIIPLTRSLMAQVAAQMNPIFSKLPDGFHIGLNISVSHINALSFIDDCLHYQRGFEGKAVKLMLEITEQEPLLLNDAVVDKLNTLHSRGFSIALDDFGTGYSGLSCLHELIFDYIKIDQSFVGRVTGEAPSSKLLDCVIEMARTLSLRIIAEGVETQVQLEYLNRQNIHLLQGYYFWKPMPYVALVMLLLSKPKARIVEE